MLTPNRFWKPNKCKKPNNISKNLWLEEMENKK